MILFENGIEIDDLDAARLGSQEYIENELLAYLKARISNAILTQKLIEAELEKEAIKPIKKNEIIGGDQEPKILA